LILALAFTTDWLNAMLLPPGLDGIAGVIEFLRLLVECPHEEGRRNDE
jgi:hypothetical protein